MSKHVIGLDYPSVNNEFLSSLGFTTKESFFDELANNYLITKDEKTGYFKFDHKDNATTECWSIPHLYDWKDPYAKSGDADLCRSTITAKQIIDGDLKKRDSLSFGYHFMQRDEAKTAMARCYEERSKMDLTSFRKERARLEAIERDEREKKKEK